MKLLPGKLNISADGQFGSCGKGLLNEYIGLNNHVDIAVSNASANAGHTFYYNGKKYVVKHIPVSGIVNKRSTIYLCAGAIINPAILLDEIDGYDIDPSRICIHPRCAIISDEDISSERNESSATTKLASTQSGVGSALSRKILRSAKLAKDIPELESMVSDLDLQWLLDQGCTALMEVPQGMDLSLNAGYAYPYCTSRDITPSSAMADAIVHPSYIGNIMLVIRTFPIRVGNIIKDGREIGNSGEFWDDSIETTWEQLGVDAEITTVTGRVRRVASFSYSQYKKALSIFKPNYILLNFANYLNGAELNSLLDKLPEVTHVGFGPQISDIKER